MRLETLSYAIPCDGRKTQRAIAREALDEPRCQHAAIDGRIRPASGQQAEEDEQPHPARQRRLQQQGVVSAAHGVLSAVKAAVGQYGGKQAQRKCGRSLPEGHQALF